MDDNSNAALFILSGVALTVSCGIQLRMPVWKYAPHLAFVLFLAGYLTLYVTLDESKSVLVRAAFTLLALYMFAAGLYCVYAANGQERGVTSGALFLCEAAVTHSMSGLHEKKVKLLLRLIALVMGGAAIWIAVALEASDRNIAMWVMLGIDALSLFAFA